MEVRFIGSLLGDGCFVKCLTSDLTFSPLLRKLAPEFNNKSKNTGQIVRDFFLKSPQF